MFCVFSSRRRHTRCGRDWSSDVCSSDLTIAGAVSFVRYARRHRPDPQLTAGAPFDIFVPGLEPRRVRLAEGLTARSGERRVGEEGRSRWGACHLKKKIKNAQRDGIVVEE